MGFLFAAARNYAGFNNRNLKFYLVEIFVNLLLWNNRKRIIFNFAVNAN